MARFDLAAIEAQLDTYFIGKNDANETWDEIGSTNNRAIELALAAAPEGVFVLARKQSGGRGRQGRTWVSPEDSGIFISIILRPTLAPSELPLISLAAGVAAAKAIESVCQIRIGLKWVNDLVFAGKKIGGILAEAPGAETGQMTASGWLLPPAVIVGMGVNLNLMQDEIPAELKDKVDSLDAICQQTVDANLLIAQILYFLEDSYNNLRHGFPEILIQDWKSYSQTLGKRVKATLGDELIEGFAEDIAATGALVLKLDDGSKRLLHAGEITIRLADGSYA